MCCDNVAINKKHKVHTYMYIYIYIYIICIYILYIHICYINIYIYIFIYIKLHNRIYSCTTIYSYTVNVNLMSICIELSELIIYCKYAWKLSLFEVINILYISVLYFLPIHSSLTYKRDMRKTPSLKILVSAINL